MIESSSSRVRLLKPRHGYSLIDVTVVAGVVSLLVMLTLPAIQAAQVDARLVQCRNNLKQIGLAMHNYHDVYKTMPPAWTAHHPNAGSGPRFGWSSSILPFIEQAPLYNSLDFRQNMPAPDELLQTSIPVYRCPSDLTPAVNSMRGNYGVNNYSVNYGAYPIVRVVPGRLSQYWPGQLPASWNGFPTGGLSAGGARIDRSQMWNGIFMLNRGAGFRDIVDGSSNTIMVSERSYLSAAGIWPGVGDNSMENDVMTDGSALSPLNGSLRSWSSLHSGTINILLCDGAVRSVSLDIDSADSLDAPYGVFQKLTSRNDGQPLGEF